MNTTAHSKIFHDLRSPLNSILGFNQLIQLSGLKDKVDQAKSEHIGSVGNTLLSLIDEISNQLQVVKFPDTISGHIQRLDYTFKVLNAVVTSYSSQNLDFDQAESLNEIKISVKELASRISQFKKIINYGASLTLN